MHPDSSYSIGGTVTFAALTADRLGLTAGLVTRASSDLINELATYLPNIALHAQPSEQTTTFANQYHEGFRTQYLYARADSLQPTDIPEAWRTAPIVLLGPLAQEISPELVAYFPRRAGAIIAATPQGWLRRWDAAGRVRPTPWHTADSILPLLDVLILSHDDLLPFADGNRSEKQVEFSRTIFAAGNDLLDLIDDILDLSKVEAGKMDVHASEVRLADVVDYVERSFRLLVEENES